MDVARKSGITIFGAGNGAIPGAGASISRDRVAAMVVTAPQADRCDDSVIALASLDERIRQ